MSESTFEEKVERFNKGYKTTRSRTILIRERFWESLAKDATSFGSLCGSIWLGVYLGSVTLQVIAGTLWVLCLLARVMGEGKKNTYTLEEAKAKIEEWESEQ